MPLQQITVSSSPARGKHLEDDQGTNREPISAVPRLQESLYSPSPVLGMERCSSQASVLSLNHDICRICHCEGDSEVPLIAPCYCSGSLRYVHQACLQQWIKSSDTKSCELCKFQFIMQSKIKPFGEWEKLAMTPVERRKLLCSVTFHAVALTCVVWSLYVLIDRTTEEVRAGLLEWPFWTKLVVVAIGFTGGLVFMYIQCKMYVQLCRRWKAFNRVIFVQNAPEKPPPPPVVVTGNAGTESARSKPLSPSLPELPLVLPPPTDSSYGDGNFSDGNFEEEVLVSVVDYPPPHSREEEEQHPLVTAVVVTTSSTNVSNGPRLTPLALAPTTPTQALCVALPDV